MKENDPVTRSFARVYEGREELTLQEALNIIMVEILGESEVTEEMLEKATEIAIALKGGEK